MSAARLKSLSWSNWSSFTLAVAQGDMVVHESLRLLPGKRLAARASFNGEPVFAKIFFSSGHHQDAAREYSIIGQLDAAGVKQAPLKCLLEGDGFSVVLQGWLSGLSSLSQVGSRRQLMSDVGEVIAVLRLLRKAGFYQRDPHLGNFARAADGQLYFFDAGDVQPLPKVRRQEAFLDSVALFCAQAPALFLAEVARRVADEFSDEVTEASLWRRINRLNNRRIRHATRKWMRDCSNVMRLSTEHGLCLMDRTFADQQTLVIEALLSPQALPLIKRGSRIAVYGDDRWVLKCYTDTSMKSRAKRLLDMSAARRSWRMGWNFSMLGLPTPRPIALLEKDDGQAVLLFPTVAGERFSEVLERDRERAENIAPQIQSAIDAMGRLNLWHGDLKAQNILLPEEGPCLIDLDAAGWSGATAFASRRHRRDIARFALNWSQFTFHASADRSQENSES